jgi:CIC family chloride channel protein
VLGSVVLASATSWAMLRLLLGNNPLFQVPQYQLVHPGEFAIYAALGVAGGFVSVAFTKLLLWMRARFLRFPKRTVWFQPVAGGLTVGIMGWFVPQLLGVGYKHVGEVLNGGMALRLMLLLLALKLVAVATSYASGNAGGIFGPSLFLGAMLGGIVGTVPLMISNLVSFFISSRFQKQPIYEVLAQQDGIHLPSVETRQQLEQRQVVHAMRDPKEILSAEMTVQEALEKSKSSKLHAWPVCDERGVIGVISLQNLKRANSDGSANKRLKEIMDAEDFPHVHADHSLHLALDRMGASHLDLLPVVSRANVHHLEGVVTLQDVLALYGVGEKGSD